MDAKAAWARIPAWGRWLLAYAGAAALCALVGLLTPLRPGGALFLGGAGLVLFSALLIRTGGPRRVVTLRGPDGGPLRREPLPEAEREREIRLGVGLFLMGLGLWALLPLALPRAL